MVKAQKKIEQQTEGSEISCYFSKRSMSLCFENSKMNEKIEKDLLFKIDWLMEEYFFEKNGLRELGWCERYLLDRRSVNYHTEQQAFKKTEIVEIY